MMTFTGLNLDYSRPIRIADGVYWVGTYDARTNWLSCPYLVVDDDCAVLIDGGSRTDFSTILVKIMQTGLLPSAIAALVYQNYSPLLWGSMHLLEKIIARQDLKIITDRATVRFFEHGTDSADILSLQEIENRFVFPSGRVLEFIKVPFAHSSGSFVSFDRKSGVLFSGDLFSGYLQDWKLSLDLDPKCLECTSFDKCPIERTACPIRGILGFHRDIMSSERALRAAMDCIAGLPFNLIAPHHGSVIHSCSHIVRVCELLVSLKGVGVDGIIGDKSFIQLGDIGPIRNRLLARDKCRTVN